MKTEHRQSQPWKNILLILSLSLLLFLRLGLCRPHHAGTTTNVTTSPRTVRPVYDLRHMGRSEIRSGERRMTNNDTLFLLSSDAGDGHPSDVIEGRRHRVVSENPGRRRRHQPEPHRRRRRKHHRRVLKARERNHLSEGEVVGGPPPPLLKSDSPGYLITNASEIRKDWCRTLPLQELVSEPQCQSRVVRNHFCYGQCNSFFIPYAASEKKREFFQSCAFCKPLRQHWGNVTLNCPGRDPPKVLKTVLFVDKCRCITEILQ